MLSKKQYITIAILQQSYFQNIALWARVRGAISKNSKKLSQWVWFVVYFHEKFDDNKNFFKEITEN